MGDQKTLYQEITEAGIPTANHESDLYFPVTPESTAILARFPSKRQNVQRFWNKGSGPPGLWYDVPFAFDPFWLAKIGGGH